MTNARRFTQTASQKFEVPVHAAELAEFLSKVPSDSEVSITKLEGGDQRDPYPVAYILKALW